MSTLLDDVIDPLLQLDLQDIVPLRGLTETPTEWLSHSDALTHLLVRNEIGEIRNVTW